MAQPSSHSRSKTPVGKNTAGLRATWDKSTLEGVSHFWFQHLGTGIPIVKDAWLCASLLLLSSCRCLSKCRVEIIPCDLYWVLASSGFRPLKPPFFKSWKPEPARIATWGFSLSSSEMGGTAKRPTKVDPLAVCAGKPKGRPCHRKLEFGALSAGERYPLLQAYTTPLPRASDHSWGLLHFLICL